jgi:hypothetical protein
MDQPPAVESLRILRLLQAALVSCESENMHLRRLMGSINGVRFD